MKKEKTTIVIAGLLIGVISAMLVYFGNPANMGFCIACFLRDTTGALGLHIIYKLSFLSATTHPFTVIFHYQGISHHGIQTIRGFCCRC